MKLLGMGGGMDFGESGNRDVFFQGKCDDGCLELARLLGWEVSEWTGLPFLSNVSSHTHTGEAEGDASSGT